MTKIQYWETYLSKHGLIASDPRGFTNNGLMYTAHYVYWLTLQPHEDGKPHSQYRAIIDSYARCWVDDGGFTRYPGSNSLNQADDYYGIAMVSKLLDLDFSERVLYVMRHNWGCLNDQWAGHFRFKSFLGRMPQLTVTLQLSAGERPSLWGLVIWIPWLFVSILGTRDSRVKGWMSSHAAYGTDPFTDKIIVSYWKWFGRRWKGVGHAEYFKMEHPVRKYLWNEITQEEL